MKNDIIQQIADCKKSGRLFVLGTIIDKKGSSPRSPGARMLIFEDGSISGTIGGGKFEKLVIDDALAMIKSGPETQVKKYKLVSKGDNATGMSCGGEADIFQEIHRPPAHLIIFGGGHVGRELIRLAVGSGFSMSVVDDRPEILKAIETSISSILTDEKYKTNLPIFNSNSYVVIISRSHENDLSILSQVIKYDCAYIGMMGSKAKISKIFNILSQSGIDQYKLDNVFTPIGLKIGAEGPYKLHWPLWLS